MSIMVLAELVTWVAIAVADLSFGGARQNMGGDWLQPMDQTQQGWVQPSLDQAMQMIDGGKPQSIGADLLPSSLDQTVNFMSGEKSPMGPNWPQFFLEHAIQMIKDGKLQEIVASLRSTVDQMLDFMNGGKPQGIGAGPLQSALNQTAKVMSGRKPQEVENWFDILRNETNYILDGLKQQEGPPLQFPLNQTTVTSHHPDLSPSLIMTTTVPLIETPTQNSNAVGVENSTVETILSKYGVEVSKDVSDIINYAIANNFARNTLRKILTALYDEIDPVYHDVYRKKVIPKLTGLSEGKQMLLDELLKTYSLTQSDKDDLSYTFVTRALGDLSKEISAGTTKHSEIRKRSKAIEQLLAKQRKAQKKERSL